MASHTSYVSKDASEKTQGSQRLAATHEGASVSPATRRRWEEREATLWFSDSTFWGGFLLRNRFLEQGSDEGFKTLRPMGRGRHTRGAP